MTIELSSLFSAPSAPWADSTDQLSPLNEVSWSSPEFFQKSDWGSSSFPFVGDLVSSRDNPAPLDYTTIKDFGFGRIFDSNPLLAAGCVDNPNDFKGVYELNGSCSGYSKFEPLTTSAPPQTLKFSAGCLDNPADYAGMFEYQGQCPGDIKPSNTFSSSNNASFESGIFPAGQHKFFNLIGNYLNGAASSLKDAYRNTDIWSTGQENLFSSFIAPKTVLGNLIQTYGTIQDGTFDLHRALDVEQTGFTGGVLNMLTIPVKAVVGYASIFNPDLSIRDTQDTALQKSALSHAIGTLSNTPASTANVANPHTFTMGGNNKFPSGTVFDAQYGKPFTFDSNCTTPYKGYENVYELSGFCPQK